MSNVKKNFIYNSAYQLLAIITPLITTPYLSRVLGASGIGRYSYSYTVAQYFAIFILLGLNNYGNRTIAMVKGNKDKLSKTFWSIYFMQCICSVIVIVLYLIYVFMISGDRTIAMLQFIYILSVSFDINWFFFGMEKFKITVTRNTFIKLISVILIITCVKSKNDVYLYTVIMVGSQILSVLLLWPFLKKMIKFEYISIRDIIPHFKPNLILFLPVIAISLYNKMDIIMVGAFSGDAEVGYYTNSEKLIQIPLSLITALGTVMLPRISNLISEGNESVARKYFDYSILFVIFMASALCFGIMGISDKFVPWFFGPGFEKCISLLMILLPCQLFISFANVVRTQYLIPYKEDKIYIKSVFLGAFINLILNILLIPSLMSIGASIGTLCAEASVCIYQSYKVRNNLNIMESFMKILPFIFFGLIMYLCLSMFPIFSKNVVIDIGINVMLGGFIYVGMSLVYYKVYLKN